MKYCKSCHTYNSDEDEVCRRCGARLGPSSSSFGRTPKVASSLSLPQRSDTRLSPNTAAPKASPSSSSSPSSLILTASCNIGIGLWTSICVSLCALFGIKSNAYGKKIEAICDEIKAELLKKMRAYPNYDFSTISFASDSRLSYVGSVIGTLKK
jgi:hypothetical protein